MNLRLPSQLKIFNRKIRTIVFNSLKEGEENGLLYYRLSKEASVVRQMMDALYRLNIQSVLIEGGAKTLQSFIEEGYWDEARTVTNQQLTLSDDKNADQGLKAPLLANEILTEELTLQNDKIKIFKSKGS
jgi:diaminohydroxyphosphoribosylaminopyrimidine deaminase/5-amino-6-(5-phosphoribosylamino)uracil reductase